MKRLVAAVTAGLAALVISPGPASAHPFGDPQTVTIAADGARPEVVHVRWKAGGLDDLVLLGVSLGLLPKDRVMLDGAVFYRDADAAAIGPSPRFAAYLLRQITVSGAGESCTGAVEAPADLAKSGVTIDYTCPAPVGTATVGVRTLTDLNPAYQTMATGPAGERTVYRQGADTHDWALGPSSSAGQHLGLSAFWQIGAVLLLAGVVVLVIRRIRGGAS
ncbi:hypothetical protein ACQP00_38755 [Dactylosporangium sp. CS-047395]|uniref:hypothetical protein n=1 Tax=Dactylosporangium sp. CS-047395 TaxID=3239936 RepID=UPI003D91664D